MTKAEMQELALNDPLKFESEGCFSEFTENETGLTFSDLREMIRRIYNMTGAFASGTVGCIHREAWCLK